MWKILIVMLLMVGCVPIKKRRYDVSQIKPLTVAEQRALSQLPRQSNYGDNYRTRIEVLADEIQETADRQRILYEQHKQTQQLQEINDQLELLRSR